MILGSVTKQPNERFKVFIDFAKRLQTGETLNSVSVTSKKVADGSDSSATIISQAAVNGPKLEARVSAGTAGDDHVVQMRASTSLGNTLEDEISLLIRED